MPTKSENVSPETVSAFRTARVSHSRWLGVNESPAGTRATHVFASVIAFDVGFTGLSLFASFGARIRARGLELGRLMVTHPERVAGLEVVAACSVNALRDLVDGDHDEEDQDGETDEQEQTLQNRRILNLRPSRERIQRH
jgi:hypothetical protein